MTSSVLDIYRTSLNLIGITRQVATLTESSLERQTCETFYPSVKDSAQQSAPWASVARSARLTLSSTVNAGALWDSTQPAPGFAYRYALPGDYLIARYLARFEPFRIEVDSSGVRHLNTNSLDAVLNYSGKNDNVPAWDEALKQTVILGLAANLALALRKDKSLAQLHLLAANDLIASQRTAETSESQVSYDYLPDRFVARGMIAPSVSTRFIYPYGSQLSLAGFNG